MGQEHTPIVPIPRCRTGSQVGREALLCFSHHPHPEGSVGVSARLQAGLCAGLQPLLVPLPPLTARARRGPGVTVPVEDGFAFTAPGKRRKKPNPMRW